MAWQAFPELSAVGGHCRRAASSGVPASTSIRSFTGGNPVKGRVESLPTALEYDSRYDSWYDRALGFGPLPWTGMRYSLRLPLPDLPTRVVEVGG